MTSNKIIQQQSRISSLHVLSCLLVLISASRIGITGAFYHGIAPPATPRSTTTVGAAARPLVPPPSTHRSGGSASFVLPELNEQANNHEAECSVRGSCKLQSQKRMKAQPVMMDGGDPAARVVSCYCDSKCHLYDDCCSDAAEPAISRSRSRARAAGASGTEGALSGSLGELEQLEDEARRAVEARNRWHCQAITGQSGGMQLLASCPSNWADESPELTPRLVRFIERRCTFVANPSLANNDSLLTDYQMDPLGMMMPISDLTSGLTFANSYCLRCNQNYHHQHQTDNNHNQVNTRPKLISWSPVLDCNYDNELDDRSSLYDLINKHKGKALQYSTKLNKWTINARLLKEQQEEEAATATESTDGAAGSADLPETATTASPELDLPAPDANTTSTSPLGVDRICTIAPSAPDEVRGLLRYCQTNRIRSCPSSRKRSALNRVCRFGPQFILFSKNSDRVYHNLACALCNGENATSIDCQPSRRKHMMPGGDDGGVVSVDKLFPNSLSPMILGSESGRSVSPFSSSFSILFDISGSTGGIAISSSVSSPGSVSKCPGQHQIWDPFFMTCRCLICGLNREFRDGKCVTRLHSMAENMAFSTMPMKMLPDKPATTNLDPPDSNNLKDQNKKHKQDENDEGSTSIGNNAKRIGLQMLIPMEMPESMRPNGNRASSPSHRQWPHQRPQLSPSNNQNQLRAANHTISKLDLEFEKILMKLDYTDLPEPSSKSREKFTICGKFTIQPEHYRLFTLSDRLLIRSHSRRSNRVIGNSEFSSNSDPDSSVRSNANDGENDGDDNNTFMLVNEQDHTPIHHHNSQQKHRRYQRSGTYAARIWAYIRPYNLLLASSEFELVRPDSLAADEYEIVGGLPPTPTSGGGESAPTADAGEIRSNPKDEPEQGSNNPNLETTTQHFDLLICAPFDNDLGQKFPLEMAYVTSLCLAISIASLTSYLFLYVISMLNLSRLQKKQRSGQSFHKMSQQSRRSSYGSSIHQQHNDSNNNNNKQQQQSFEPQQTQRNQPRTNRSKSEAHSTSGIYSHSPRKSLSSQGVTCLASSLLAAYILFILSNQYVSHMSTPNELTKFNQSGLQTPSNQESQAAVQTDWGCKLLAVATNYCFLVAFMWMLLMSYDIWRSLRLATVHFRLPSKTYRAKRFASYLSFSLIGSGIIVGSSLVIDEMPELCMDESGNFSCSFIESSINKFIREFRPRFGYNRPAGVCWFTSRKSLALFFGFPVTIIVAINLIYFILCSFMVIKTTIKSKHKDPAPFVSASTNAYRRPSISNQPEFRIQRCSYQDNDGAGQPFAGRRAHMIGPDQANHFGSHRSAVTMQSSLGGISCSSSNLIGCSSAASSTSGSSSLYGDGEITPPIEAISCAGMSPTILDANQFTDTHPLQQQPATIQRLEELSVSALPAPPALPPASGGPMNFHQPANSIDHSKNSQLHKLEPQISSNSLTSNGSSVGSTISISSNSFAHTIVAKYDAHKSQLTTMVNTIIQDYRLYCRLSTLMGLTWLIGILASIVNKSRVLWYLFIILNALQGLFIFIAFGLNREKLRNLLILIGYIRFRINRFFINRLLSKWEHKVGAC